MTPPLLAARDVSRSYRRGSETVEALSDVTLDLERGAVYVLQGPSGSGKTTLLNVLGGWEQPDSGTVAWRGEVVDPGTLGWADLAVVPQRVGLLEELTAGENVTLAHRILGYRDYDPGGLFAAVGLEGLEDAFPDELSAGQQQRVSIVRAIIGPPAAVLVDEPTSSQDEDHARLVLSELSRLAAGGSLCLIAGHDPIAAEFADVMLEIRDGSLHPGSPG